MDGTLMTQMMQTNADKICRVDDGTLMTQMMQTNAD